MADKAMKKSAPRRHSKVVGPGGTYDWESSPAFKDDARQSPWDVGRKPPVMYRKASFYMNKEADWGEWGKWLSSLWEGVKSWWSGLGKGSPAGGAQAAGAATPQQPVFGPQPPPGHPQTDQGGGNWWESGGVPRKPVAPTQPASQQPVYGPQPPPGHPQVGQGSAPRQASPAQLGTSSAPPVGQSGAASRFVRPGDPVAPNSSVRFNPAYIGYHKQRAAKMYDAQGNPQVDMAGFGKIKGINHAEQLPTGGDDIISFVAQNEIPAGMERVYDEKKSFNPSQQMYYYADLSARNNANVGPANMAQYTGGKEFDAAGNLVPWEQARQSFWDKGVQDGKIKPDEFTAGGKQMGPMGSVYDPASQQVYNDKMHNYAMQYMSSGANVDRAYQMAHSDMLQRENMYMPEDHVSSLVGSSYSPEDRQVLEDYSRYRMDASAPGYNQDSGSIKKVFDLQAKLNPGFGLGMQAGEAAVNALSAPKFEDWVEAASKQNPGFAKVYALNKNNPEWVAAMQNSPEVKAWQEKNTNPGYTGVGAMIGAGMAGGAVQGAALRKAAPLLTKIPGAGAIGSGAKVVGGVAGRFAPVASLVYDLGNEATQLDDQADDVEFLRGVDRSEAKRQARAQRAAMRDRVGFRGLASNFDTLGVVQHGMNHVENAVGLGDGPRPDMRADILRRAHSSSNPLIQQQMAGMMGGMMNPDAGTSWLMYNRPDLRGQLSSAEAERMAQTEMAYRGLDPNDPASYANFDRYLRDNGMWGADE